MISWICTVAILETPEFPFPEVMFQTHLEFHCRKHGQKSHCELSELHCSSSQYKLGGTDEDGERERGREKERKRESPQVLKFKGFSYRMGTRNTQRKRQNFISFISFPFVSCSRMARFEWIAEKNAPGRSDIVGFTPINHLSNQQWPVVIVNIDKHHPGQNGDAQWMAIPWFLPLD